MNTPTIIKKTLPSTNLNSVESTNKESDSTLTSKAKNSLKVIENKLPILPNSDEIYVQLLKAIVPTSKEKIHQDVVDKLASYEIKAKIEYMDNSIFSEKSGLKRLITNFEETFEEAKKVSLDETIIAFLQLRSIVLKVLDKPCKGVQIKGRARHLNQVPKKAIEIIDKPSKDFRIEERVSHLNTNKILTNTTATRNYNTNPYDTMKTSPAMGKWIETWLHIDPSKNWEEVVSKPTFHTDNANLSHKQMKQIKSLFNENKTYEAIFNAYDHLITYLEGAFITLPYGESASEKDAQNGLSPLAPTKA